MSETTSDNPDYAAPAAEASAPTPSPVGQKKAFLLDQKTGRYTRQVVTAADLAEPPDRFSHDPMGLGEDWDKGRGKEMHAHWANANPRWRNTENQYKYRPIDPAEVPREIRDRFMVAEVDGYEGDCLVHGDAVLVECPLWLKEHRDKRRLKLEKERNAELWGFGGEVEDLNSRYGADARFSAKVDSRVGGHIDDMADPRGNYGRPTSYALGDEANNAMADAELEAEYEARRGSSFGGFQGNPQYNQTRWSKDTATR